MEFHFKSFIFSAFISINCFAQAQPNQEQPTDITLLISIDGFRHDYLDKYRPPELLTIANEGLRVSKLLPIYPSKTFPNHLSIITGKYAANHGIVHNEFYSKAKGKVYKKGSAAKDPSWINGLPLWLLAQEQGVRSAVVFWPEANAKLSIDLPQDIIKWHRGVSDKELIDKLINLLERAPQKRPQFIATYLSSVDMAGHAFGPNSKKLAQAVSYIDDQIARLRRQIKRLNLQVNLVIVSDHGMSDLSDAKKIIWSDLINPNEQVVVINAGTQLMISGKQHVNAQAELTRLKTQLQHQANGRYQVLEPNQLAELSYVGPNVADIICEVLPPYIFTDGMFSILSNGNHGWNVNNNPDMAGFMVASGPNFTANSVISATENINVYPLIATLLKLTIKHKIDGKLTVFAPHLD